MVDSIHIADIDKLFICRWEVGLVSGVGKTSALELKKSGKLYFCGLESGLLVFGGWESGLLVFCGWESRG